MTTGSISVLTWNVWWRYGPWRERQDAIIQTLRNENADVVCLQGVWGESGGADQAKIFADELGYNVVRSPYNWQEGLSFGNAILSRFTVKQHETVELARDPVRPFTRTVILAELVVDDHLVRIFNTHLEWFHDASALRQKQLGEVCKLISRTRRDPDNEFPPILCGDFNAEPDSDEVRQLIGKAAPQVSGLVFTDAWTAARPGVDGATWSWRNTYRDPDDVDLVDKRVDYLLVGLPRPKRLGAPSNVRLVGVEPIAGVLPSDHYGVRVDLSLSS